MMTSASLRVRSVRTERTPTPLPAAGGSAAPWEALPDASPTERKRWEHDSRNMTTEHEGRTMTAARRRCEKTVGADGGPLYRHIVVACRRKGQRCPTANCGERRTVNGERED